MGRVAAVTRPKLFSADRVPVSAKSFNYLYIYIFFYISLALRDSEKKKPKKPQLSYP